MAELTIPEQKEDLVKAIEYLREIQQIAERQMHVLSAGIKSLDEGEDIFTSNSAIANEVKEIMYRFPNVK